jgi:subtilisin family serine protease/subtilisin-like proprotein convertase family protein
MTLRIIAPLLTLILLLPAIGQSAAPVHGEIKGSGPEIYIIHLAGDPVATYGGGIVGLAATSPKATGARRLDPHSRASAAYVDYLAVRQANFLEDLALLLGRSPDLRFEYRHAINGVAVVLSPDEARQVAKMDEVVRLERDREEHLQSDAGPDFIGATAAWAGSMTALDYHTELTGANEVPPNGSTASGFGTFVYNVANRQLNYSIETSGLTATAAHIHDGAAGVNGPIAHPLDHTSNPMQGVWTLTTTEAGKLANAGLYVNVHTAAFPGGEIRGQIRIDGTRGEGVIVGIIDIGINQGHPSFAAVAGDGYAHANPFGPGNYVGYCVANPSFCNNKLIGAWALNPNSSNPTDSDGHGSHTAGIAAGNMLVNAPFTAPTQTLVFPTVSGVAPRANVIVYQVCAPSCPTSSTTAAVNQAVIDGVDVINYAISGGTNPYVETTSLAFLNATAAGVFVSAQAGNSGPGASTLNNQAPWVMSMAALTHKREILNAVTELASSNGALPDILGESPTSAFGPAALVYAGDPPYNNPLCNPFPGGTFSGQIVVCDRGVFGRVQKGSNVLAGGGGGMILANDAPNAASLNADPHVLPAVHVSHADGIVLKSWMASGSGHQGAISGGSVDRHGPGDSMASFSARGPAGSVVPGLANLVKPDLGAPGLNILAATRAGFSAPPEFNLLSGTSMSSAHGTGAAALMRSLQPAWTPAEIKSALMLTAAIAVKKEDGITAADPFDVGAGRLDLRRAMRAGFVLNTTKAEFEAANPATGGDPRLLNQASLGDANCNDVCSWTRRLRSVLPVSQTYNATLITPPGISGSVSPSSFTLATGATQEITVSLDASAAALGSWVFARVVIDPVIATTAKSSGARFAGSPAVTIPDNQYRGGFGAPSMACHAIDTTSLPAGSSVRGVQVDLTAAHARVGDLVIKLRGPDGRILGLMSRPGAAEAADDGGAGTAPFGASANMEVGHPVTFRDGGKKNAELMGNTLTTAEVVCRDDAACDYFPNPGSAAGLTNFNGFVGAPAAGAWTLCVGDRAPGELGTFQAWTLALDYDESLPLVVSAQMPVAARSFPSKIFADGFEG